MHHPASLLSDHGRSSRRRGLLLAASLAAATCAGIAPLRAQGGPTNIPGLVVSMPPTGAQPMPPTAQPPAQPVTAVAVPPPATKPMVKPKPKPAASTAKAAPATSTGKGWSGGQAVVAFVNDEPITAYDVAQRSQLMAMQSNIGARAQENFKHLVQMESTQKAFRAAIEDLIKKYQTTKTKDQILAMIEEQKKQFSLNLQKQAVESARASVLPTLKKGALEELIEERIKLQEAKRNNITIEDSQVDTVFRGLADRNHTTEAALTESFKRMGVEPAALKARYRAQLAWAEVIRRRFTAVVSVSQREVDKFISTSPEGEDQVELTVSRLTLAVSGKLDQRVMAQRFSEADRLRGSFSGCKSMAALAAKVPDTRFEDLGVRKPSSITEPTRTLLLNARDGEMVPPSMGEAGIELYAVCGRKVVKADDQKRQQAQNELQQKEFEIYARRHLRDLRQDAQIEYR